MWNGLKQMNNLKNDEILNVNMLKSKHFLYCCFYNRLFLFFLLGRIKLVGILKETAAGQLHMLFSKMVFCCKEPDWNTHVKPRTEFLNDFCLETISMIVTALTNLECTRVNIMYVWEGQKRRSNCNVSGALVISNILVRKPVYSPVRKAHLFQQQVNPSLFALLPVSMEHFCTKSVENRSVVQLAECKSAVTSYLL